MCSIVSARGDRLSDGVRRKSAEGLREGDTNRWPYQSVLRLVFNLDTEGMRSDEGA